MKTLKSIWITLALCFINLIIFSQSISVLGGMGFNKRYSFKKKSNGEYFEQTPKIYYSYGVGYSIFKETVSFFIRYNNYSSEHYNRYVALGGSSETFYKLKRQTISLCGMYKFFEYKNRFSANIETDIATNILSKYSGKTYSRVGPSYDSLFVNETNKNPKINIGIALSVSYKIPLTKNWQLAPTFRYYKGISKEYDYYFTRPSFELHLKKNSRK